MTIRWFTQFALVLCVIFPMSAQSAPALYSFSSDPATSSSDPALLAIFDTLTVSGSFIYDDTAPFTRAGASTASIYDGGSTDMVGSVGGMEFSDPYGTVIVGDNVAGPFLQDALRIRSLPFDDPATPEFSPGPNLVGFPITAGATDYILVRVRIDWIGGEFLANQDLPSPLPVQNGVFALEFATSADPEVVAAEVFFPGVTVIAGAADDSDGIAPAIDSDSSVFSNDFSDGVTFGSVIDRSDLSLQVTDHPDPLQGVVLTVNGGTGTAHVQMCSDPLTSIFLTDGDQLIATCGSFIGEPLSGPVTVTVGININVTVPVGGIVEIDQITESFLSITNVGEAGGPDIVVNDGGTEIPLAPNVTTGVTFQATVEIDIKPGSRRNFVIPRSRGYVVVAVPSTDAADGDPIGFDASDIDRSTVTFGPDGATPRFSFLFDIDRDRDRDAIFFFRTRDTGIQCGDTEATLTGLTTAGTVITGTDSIRTIFCR